MAGFFNKLKAASTGGSGSSGSASANKKKDEPTPDLTPLEKMLLPLGQIREDGSDKFFGLENFGNTCYCNSIVQALYYSESFRENVVKYPPFSPSDTPNGKPAKINVQIRPPMNGTVEQPPPGKQKSISTAQAIKQRQSINGTGVGGTGLVPQRPEDRPDSPEYKKKQAMLKGPVLDLAQENSAAYGMEESTFTGLKDLFTALIESPSRTGVLSPQRFLEIFKRDNEMFRNSMHQDAHEFYGLVLNDVISNVEANAKRMQERAETMAKDDLARSVENALGASTAVMKSQSGGARSPGTGWVHDIFEGLLTSETKCLTCETTSQRDETFLDLSIDLEEHSSVTSCLQKFSAEEMLCERNKFHCDHCGGLQEAEKRMKIKRLPRVLALHLKRFKYTEDYSRLQKLFHRVVYPYHLRMFNTTEDAEDPDRLYELYAVVVHIGGNAYHGHYVAVIKTPDFGWLLFDDEMVEPVDKHFVRNFFGDKPGMACAYVLFYQETTLEKVMAEQEADGLEDILMAQQAADLGLEQTNGTVPLSKQITTPISPIDDQDTLAALDQALKEQKMANGTALPPPGAPVPTPASQAQLAVAAPASTPTAANHTAKQTKEEKEREKKEHKAQEKARKAAEKEQAKQEEKQRKEKEARAKEARRVQADEMKRALQASKQTAAEEEEIQKREAKEATAAAAKDKDKEKDKDASGGGGSAGTHHSSSPVSGFLNRSKTVGAKTMSRRSFAFLNKDKDKDKDKEKHGGVADNPDKEKAESSEHASTSASASNGTPQSPHHPDGHPKLKERFSFGLGRKKSNNVLS